MKRHASLLLLGSATILTGMVGVAVLPASAQPAPTTVLTSLSDGTTSGPTLTEPPSTLVSDAGTFTSGTGATATGSVTYTVFSDPACTNVVDALSPESITTPGILPASSSVSLPVGTYYWQVSYSGDSNNAPATSVCGSEIETVLSSAASSTTKTKPGGSDKGILQGASNTDTATVTGNATDGPPTGTVNFTLCGPYAAAEHPTPCTAATDMTSIPVTLTPATNDTSTATSAPFTPLSPGEWCFDNSYSGDSHYYSSSDNKKAECFFVSALPGSPDYAGVALIQNAGQTQNATSPDQPSSTSSAQTTFTVPTESCTSTATGVILGSGIFSSISNWVSAAGVVVACTGGVPSYSTQEDVNNTVYPVGITPVPGDTVTTTVNIVPASTTVTLDDVTQGVSQSETGAGMTGTYMSDGVDGDGQPNPLPPGDFGATTFTDSSINGKSLLAAARPRSAGSTRRCSRSSRPQ